MLLSGKSIPPFGLSILLSIPLIVGLSFYVSIHLSIPPYCLNINLAILQNCVYLPVGF